MTTILAEHVPLDSRAWLLSHGVRVAVILALAVGVSWVARLAVRRMQRKLEGVKSVTQSLDVQRVATLTQSLSYVTRIVIWTLALLMVLDQFAVNLAPLLAGAGIAGVALGFGAQSLVKDFLSGFFILLENQFGVGDVIEVNVSGGPVTGKVEQVSLRTTWIRAFDGTLHVVPNGNIQVVGNRYKGWARAIVDVGLAYTEDIERVKQVLEGLFDELMADAGLRDGFISQPSVLGVERFTDYEVVVRIVAEVRPSRRVDLERELRRRIKERLDREGIAMPTPLAAPAPRPGDEPADPPEKP
jgi:small conductance mechanosensitive channel